MKNSHVLFIIVILGFAMFSPLVPQIAQRAFSSSEAPAVVWSKTYSGATASESYVVIQTGDGGYAIAGTTEAFGAGKRDFWLIKTDVNGNTQWNKTYGGTNIDYANSVIQTNDGGYAIVGCSWSFSGWHDGWLAKTDANGNMQWNRVFGGADVDGIGSVVQTNDGGYALGGSTCSMGAGYYDFWLIKTNASGNAQWQKTYGGANADVAQTVVQTSDGGYALCGSTNSFGVGTDFWLVKTDAAGSMQWNETFSRTDGDDYGRSMIQTSDEGFAMAGETDHWGNADFWLIKTNAVGSLLWDKTYGGAQWDGACSIVQTTDGGYALAGQTYSFGAGGSDYWLVNTDMNGNMEWNQTFGGAGDDRGWSVIQTLDGGFALVGWTNSFSGYAHYDVWLIKLASSGHAPKTWVVDDDGPADFHTIQEAINAASGGDTISVRNGTYYEHLIINKTLQLIGEDRNATIIDGEYKDPPEMVGSVVLVVANNLKMSGFTIQHCRAGGNAICQDNYVNMTFSGNIITGCNEGIRILHSSGNIISDNIIQDCYYNTGLGFNWAYNNIVYGNIIANGNVGIGGNHWNNTFYNNTIRDNEGGWAGWGISDNFYGCVFFHNNIINNGHQVYNTNPNSNIWDDGYPSGGNYWSDYPGTDANADGIGDTPYVIDQQNIDHYPLMSTFPSPSESMAPVADFTWSPPDPIANETITLDASISKNGWNGTSSIPISNYSWDFGDNSTSNGQVVTHAYSTTGNFTVRLNVTDIQGLWNTTEKQVQVGQQRAPLGSFVMNPETAHVNDVVEFNASGSISGWNGTHENPIVSYTWDFGDGNGTSSVESTINHSYAEAGVFNVTLTVSDSGNVNSSFSRAVLVIMPTSLSVSTSSTSTVVGFIVSINGTLSDANGVGLEGEPVVIYYTFPGVTNWFPLTSGITDNLGHYNAQWIPTATGTFTLKAEWAGNVTYSGANENVTLSSVPYMNQYIFAVESNSTISALAFNSSNLELGFTASGPSGTSGFARITIAKSLVADIATIRVYLDNGLTDFTITPSDSSWLLTFNYTHSTHKVRVDLDINVIPEFGSSTILVLLAVLTTFAAVLRKRKLVRARNLPSAR